MDRDQADDNLSLGTASLAVPKMVRDYFQGSDMSLQEYFRFPEMKHIRNPVHEYFRLRSAGEDDWIQEGTMPIEEDDDGWVLLGGEHQELARIAVGRSGNRHYLARDWDGFYVGPVLRTTGAVLKGSAGLVKGTVMLTGRVLYRVASVVLRPSPSIPPKDAPLEDRFVEECVQVGGDTWWFRVWLPPDMTEVRKRHDGALPAFLLLHGFKECGWDNWWQTNSGLASALTNQKWADWFPGILVLPQLPRRPWDEQWWTHWRAPQMQQMALACLEQAVAKYGADRKRLYLLGESLGTEGAWYLAAARPGLFAAVGGSCGSVEPYDWTNWEWGSEPESYKRLADGIGRDTPMWFCHGGQDDFVPIDQSRKLHTALQEKRMVSAVGAILGRSEAADVVFKEYDDLHHHVWERAYNEDGMIEWLSSHKKA